MFAALLGALFLFAAAPAQAQNLVSNLVATSGDGKLTLTWTNPQVATSADSIFIRWKVQNTSTWLNNGGLNGLEVIGTSNRQTWDITNLTNGTTYDVDVRFAAGGVGGTNWVSTTGSPQRPPYILSVDATPACGTEVTDTSMQPTYALMLTPAPDMNIETESRFITPQTNWESSVLSIGMSGSSIYIPRDITFAQLRNAYPGFNGFEFRLANDHSVTAQCFWTFTDPMPPPPPPPGPPTVSVPPTGGGSPPAEPSDPTPDSPRCGENNREDLERFYEATGGDAWDRSEYWNSQEPLDQWFGVGTDEDGEVVSLRLEENNLSGDMPTKELLCLTELKELALWGNDDLSGEVPDELVLRVERAALRDIAEMLDLNPEWFYDYEDPFDFEDWHEGVTTDQDGRVTELDLPGEIPESIRSQFKKLRGIMITTSSGGCALSPESSSAFSLFLLTLVVFAALGRKRAR